MCGVSFGVFVSSIVVLISKRNEHNVYEVSYDDGFKYRHLSQEELADYLTKSNDILRDVKWTAE